VEGSQISDYWRDPLGDEVGRCADGVFVTDDFAEDRVELNPMQRLSQRGPPMAQDFMGAFN
jgi:hypothetical protein